MRRRLLSPLLPLLVIASGCNDYGYVELQVSDLFQQGGVGHYSDVLFVLDDSASMNEEQDRLLNSFAAFTDVLETTRADFQLGVVTTDADAGAALNSTILDPDNDALTDLFLEAIDVDETGSNVEQGLHQALLAVNPTRNPGFLRTGAELHVVIVSDEDDQSEQTVDFYLHELISLTGEDRVTVHSLVGDMPAGCASGISAADAGPRYLEATETTGGLSGSVCSEDFSPLLGQVGLDVADWNDRFELSRIPRLDSVEVWVDDVLMPQRDTDGWQYGARDNTIVFEGRAIPRPGMAVRVDYEIDVGGGDTG